MDKPYLAGLFLFMKTTTLTHESLMPFGKYKGLKLSEVPPPYLLFLYHKQILKGPLLSYVFNNIDAFNAHSAINNKTRFFNKKYYLSKR